MTLTVHPSGLSEQADGVRCLKGPEMKIAG
jgi:hypothetical protein